MRCIVTAGPTFEPLDKVRRLTNFSTGRLGSELVNYLTDKGYEVTLLIGQQASYRGERRARQVINFGTTASLRDQLRALSDSSIGAVFHAAAVGDFTFGKIWSRSPAGELTEIRSGKVSTREGTLMAELVPTPKIITELRDWFPQANLVGWKYEVDGDRASVVRLALEQIKACRTTACVANGPAYGTGFGLVTGDGLCAHVADAQGLYQALGKYAGSRGR
jgi:phosphopantothenoylcysteine decarboxylase/phosphopantothenate--cysteine ligase